MSIYITCILQRKQYPYLVSCVSFCDTYIDSIFLNVIIVRSLVHSRRSLSIIERTTARGRVAAKLKKAQNTSEKRAPYFMFEAPSVIVSFLDRTLLVFSTSVTCRYSRYIDPTSKINMSSQLDNYKHAITTVRQINTQYLIIKWHKIR